MPGQRAGLTHEAVLHAARSLLTQDGLDGLSMRRLAGSLGVAPNALYSHVAGKDALLDAILDDVLGAVDSPDPQAVEPREGLRRIMESTFTVLLSHPELVPHFLARQGARGGNAERLGAVMFEFFAAAGITGPDANDARRVLIVYTIGFAAMAARSAADAGEAPLSRDDLTANFHTGLDWLLTGITDGRHSPNS